MIGRVSTDRGTRFKSGAGSSRSREKRKRSRRERRRLRWLMMPRCGRRCCLRRRGRDPTRTCHPVHGNLFAWRWNRDKEKEERGEEKEQEEEEKEKKTEKGEKEEKEACA